MNIAFVHDGTPYPYRRGGSEQSMWTIVSGLAERGNSVTQLSLSEPGLLRRVKKALLTFFPFSDITTDFFSKTEQDENFCVLSVPGITACYYEKFLARAKPDLVLVTDNGGKHLDRIVSQTINRNIPIVLFARSSDSLAKTLPVNPQLWVIANSDYQARLITNAGKNCHFRSYPPIDPANYKTEDGKRRFVTFINPIPLKGIEIVSKAIHAMPYRQFMLVGGTWGLEQQERAVLKSLGLNALQNVSLMPAQKNMKVVYEQTRLLLAPTHAPEMFGRVVLEAQLSGIPVIATPVGGLPESIGKGGILLKDRDDIGGLIEAIDLILDDCNYEKYSKLARENAALDHFNMHHEMVRLEQFFRDIIEHPEKLQPLA